MIRCKRCQKKLADLFNFVGKVVIQCPRCRIGNVFESTDGRAVTVGLASQIDPSILFAQLEERWEQALARRMQERAEVAKGLRFKVFVRDGFRCQYCGRTVQDGALLHADHVIPRSKGGPDTIDNLTTACASCNLGKGALVLAP